MSDASSVEVNVYVEVKMMLDGGSTWKGVPSHLQTDVTAPVCSRQSWRAVTIVGSHAENPLGIDAEIEHSSPSAIPHGAHAL